jgi:hypothetical protein
VDITTVDLAGHLTAESVDATLGSVDVPDCDCALLIDCMHMTGYDNEARERFVVWNREHKERLRRVAVVTDKPLWRMVISAMSLASGQQMRGFASRGEAEQWLSDSVAR